MDFFLADAPYSIRKDGKNDHMDYYEVGSNVMKDIARILQNIINPGAYAYVFCSALHFSSGTKPLASLKL